MATRKRAGTTAAAKYPRLTVSTFPATQVIYEHSNSLDGRSWRVSVGKSENSYNFMPDGTPCVCVTMDCGDSVELTKTEAETLGKLILEAAAQL